MGGASSKQIDSRKGKGRSDDQSIQEVSGHRDGAIQSVQTLRAHFHDVCSHPGCQETVPPLTYDKIFDAWLSGSQTIPPTSQFSVWCCRHGHSTCVGCGSRPTLSSESFFTPLGVVNHCCNDGRLFAVWFLLAQFDTMSIESQFNKETNNKREKSRSKPKQKAKAKAPVPGVGYGTDFGGMDSWSDEEMFIHGHMAHTMFAGHPAAASSLADRDEDILDENDSQDYLLADTVKILGTCLPSVDSDTTIELDMFRLDITERLDVYQATAGFITKIASHPGLVQLLLEERPNKANTPGLGELSKGSYLPTEGFNNGSTSKPLIASYGDTFLQAKTFLDMSQNPKATMQAKESWRSKESNKLLQELVRCFEALDVIASSVVAPVTEPSMQEAWVKFAEDNRVTFTDDVLLRHRYTDNFKALQTSNRGRLTTISKEIATLKTSLPTGIFLKVAESRSDVMKVLIIGSEGSPYAGGLFIFDIFLDERYPATPPKMTFTLHGNDEDGESFNPNLHIHSGTVCLSLLNTWPGDPSQAWQPYKSTILSVLVSIQAMILGAPMPWENEPGFEGTGPTSRNLAHKARVQSRTLRFAMIAWLENRFADPQAKEHIWKEISQTYWQHNGLKVLEYVREWVSENPGLLNFGPTDYWLRHIKGINPRLPPGAAQNNLAEKLTVLLGVSYVPAAFPTVEIQVKQQRPKRKSSTSKDPTGSSKKVKGPGTVPAHFKWIYARDKSQKMVKKACKEFGIGYANTIKASIEKLENHVNSDMEDIDDDLIDNWGELVLDSTQSLSSQPDHEGDYMESMKWQTEVQAMVGNSQMAAGTFSGLPTLPHPFSQSNLEYGAISSDTQSLAPLLPHQTSHFLAAHTAQASGSNTPKLFNKKFGSANGPSTPPMASYSGPKFHFKSNKQHQAQTKGNGTSMDDAVALDDN
ncbi:hypothetical protein ONS96_002138 [Cadophora gregata f. sp. sojae]|nr:hypothetical protein ONS96_002138 [Cadophora gregata f. sp. sojae]